MASTSTETTGLGGSYSLGLGGLGWGECAPTAGQALSHTELVLVSSVLKDG